MRVLSISSSPRAVAQNTRNSRANKRVPLLTSASPAPYLASRRQRLLQTCSTSSGSAAPYPSEPGKPENLPSDPDATVEGSPEGTDPAPQPSGFAGWWRAQQQKGSEGRAKLAALGLAAVLAYGLFDGVSYTIAFTIAFLGYEARTGLNPTQNVADLVKICILMWAGNNVTRPFRIAGAAALAPFMDRVMEGLRKRLRLPSKFLAFLLVTAVVAGACLSVVGALFLSRWVKG